MLGPSFPAGYVPRKLTPMPLNESLCFPLYLLVTGLRARRPAWTATTIRSTWPTGRQPILRTSKNIFAIFPEFRDPVVNNPRGFR